MAVLGLFASHCWVLEGVLFGSHLGKKMALVDLVGWGDSGNLHGTWMTESIISASDSRLKSEASSNATVLNHCQTKR